MHVYIAPGETTLEDNFFKKTERSYYFDHWLHVSFFSFFFCLGFTVCQDYFTHFQQSQSEGGAKTGDPWKNTPDHPQAELGLFRVTRARLELTVWDDERFRVLKISNLITTQPRGPHVACFKKYLCPLILCLFFVILHLYMYIASAGADNLFGQKFWCQQKGLITSASNFIHIFSWFNKCI